MNLRALAAAAAVGGLCCLLAGRVVAAGVPEPGGTRVSCAECGMGAEVAGRFTARLAAGGATLYFCDIGDLVAYLARVQPREYGAAVRDFASGDWLDAAAAAYVVDPKAYATPMGWGVAAFRDRAAAPSASLDFAGLRKALR